MQYTSYQPEGFRGKSDSRLPQLVKQLGRLLADTQRKLSYEILRLDKEDREELAGVLVDLAVDIHNGIGIWEAYEQYNIEFFGTPLPLTSNEQPQGIDVNRIQHLLWIIYPVMIPDFLLAPNHTDLRRGPLAVWHFLKDKIPFLPQDCGVKVFLGSANDYGWDVKRKLVWLATNSYMFRLVYGNYIFDQNGGKLDIWHTDDFVCQECTSWSGLGAIDILARVLAITDDERKELRSWYERLAAPYLLKRVSNETIEALNVINETKYRIRLNVDRQPFKEGQLVFGSLTKARKSSRSTTPSCRACGRGAKT